MSSVASLPPRFLSRASFRRFTVDEYHRMIRGGILTTGEPFELLEGYMVQKMARGTPHDNAMDQFDGVLLPLLPAGWFARSQRAVTLADSEPEPDVAVVRGPRGRYRDAHPTPADIGLLVEVSDSSLDIDVDDKTRIYARAGVPVYWVVNIPDRRVEVYAAPDPAATPPAYRTRQLFHPGDAVPLVLDGNAVGSVAVADVLGGGDR